MSHWSVRGEQSTSTEIAALTNLTALGISGPGEAIVKTGTDTFANAVVGGSTELEVGITEITGGTTTRILYNNAGILGEYTITGTGTVAVMATGPTLTNPVVGTQSPGNNTTLAASTAFVVDAITTAVIGLLDYRGSYDASTNLFPATGGSGIAGAILKGDFWICSVAGTLGGIAVTPGDLIIALIDTPAQTAANWDLIAHNLGSYVTSITGTANQVIASASTGAVTLSLPQSIGTGSSPTFGGLALGSGNLTMTGSIAETGNRVTKLWATDIESTNMPTVGGTSLSSTFAPIASPTFTGTVTLGVMAGTIDAGGATSFEIPNANATVGSTTGLIAIDTTVTDFSHGLLEYYSGEALGVVAMPIAEFTSPVDGDIVVYNGTADEFQLQQPAGGGNPGFDFVSYNTATNQASITVSGLNLASDLCYKIIFQAIADSGTNGIVQMTVGGTGLGAYVSGIQYVAQSGASNSIGNSGMNSSGYWRLNSESGRSFNGEYLLALGSNDGSQNIAMLSGTGGTFSATQASTARIAATIEIATLTSIIFTHDSATPNWRVWVFKAATS